MELFLMLQVKITLTETFINPLFQFLSQAVFETVRFLLEQDLQSFRKGFGEIYARLAVLYARLPCRRFVHECNDISYFDPVRAQFFMPGLQEGLPLLRDFVSGFVVPQLVASDRHLTCWTAGRKFLG